MDTIIKTDVYENHHNFEIVDRYFLLKRYKETFLNLIRCYSSINDKTLITFLTKKCKSN